MNNSVWSLMTTRDGISAQLTGRGPSRSPPRTSAAAPSSACHRPPPHRAPLLRRLRAAAA